MSTVQISPPAAALVLASQSVRRLELLRQLGAEPVCRPVDADETPLKNETAKSLVERLASLKASTCAKMLLTTESAADSECVIVGADTVVELNGMVLGKPRDAEHCVQMLQRLSDKEHSVHSGVCVLELGSGKIQSTVVSTQVRFAPISAETAHRYWLTGEPADKAGSYAIQGIGAQFVVHLSGSYSNVVGLPLFETNALLNQAGITYL